MYISKKDALTWFEFFSMLPEGEELLVWQQEIVYAVLSQIEEAVDARMDSLLLEIPGLKTIDNRSFYVGDGGKFPGGCLSCLCGTGLSASSPSGSARSFGSGRVSFRAWRVSSCFCIPVSMASTSSTPVWKGTSCSTTRGGQIFFAAPNAAQAPPSDTSSAQS